MSTLTSYKDGSLGALNMAAHRDGSLGALNMTTYRDGSLGCGCGGGSVGALDFSTWGTSQKVLGAAAALGVLYFLGKKTKLIKNPRRKARRSRRRRR